MKTLPSSAAMAELTRTGTLRVGINHSNFLLSSRDPDTGAYRGIVVDLAGEIAARLGVGFTVVGYPNPGTMADAATTDAWDICFMGSEPARAQTIAFSHAYLEIDAGYLVPAGSPIATLDDVDRSGVRIALMNKSAYDLYLSRHIRHATLVRAASIDASYDVFVADRLEVLAGLKPRLLSDAARLPGSRILDGRFTAIQQSIGTPRPNAAAAPFLASFVEEAKAAGLVAAAIARHGVHGVSVAAPA
jgi:polar amino acid transport system substrate-binding protein